MYNMYFLTCLCVYMCVRMYVRAHVQLYVVLGSLYLVPSASYQIYSIRIQILSNFDNDSILCINGDNSKKP